MKLDGEKLLADLDRDIKELQSEAVESSKIGWFEKAAKAHLHAEGLIKARQLIRLGDYTIKDKG